MIAFSCFNEILHSGAFTLIANGVMSGENWARITSSAFRQQEKAAVYQQPLIRRQQRVVLFKKFKDEEGKSVDGW